MAVGIAIFGIIQFVFRGNLPQWLLVSRDTTLFGYYGTDLTRATGLIGNTIVFAATMLLFFALGVGRLVYRFRSRDLLPLGLILTAIIVSFSRAAMAGAMLIILCALSFMALRSRPEKALLATLTLLFPCIGLGLIFAVWPRALSGVTDSFIYEGLFRGRNASVSDSTEAHLAFIELAQRTMRQEPWVGLGVATQDPGSVHGRTSTVITDGAIWAVFTEGGIILGVAYATFILSCGGALVVAWRSANYARPLILGFALFVTFQLGLASIYNSAIFGKAPFILSWVVFGVIMGLARGEAVDYGGTIENAKLNRNCSGAS